MRNDSLLTCITAGLLVFGCATVLGADEKTYSVQGLPQQPIIDGKIKNDPAWERIPEEGNFAVLGKEEPPPRDTFFRMGCRGENMYVAVRCEEPRMDQLEGDPDDTTKIWTDDCIELFFRPSGTKRYQQFLINAFGAMRKTYQPGNDIVSTTAEVAVSRNETNWCIELKIPFTDVKNVAHPDTPWTGNIARDRQPSESFRATWTPVNRMHEPEKFGTFVFKENPGLTDRESIRIHKEIIGTYADEINANVEKMASQWGQWKASMNNKENAPAVKRLKRLKEQYRLGAKETKRRFENVRQLTKYDDLYPLWKPDKSVPKSKNIPVLEKVKFRVIKKWQPEVDGYRWLHGVALAWHEDKLYATFGHNKGSENTITEKARGRVSSDGGKTWGDVFTIDAGKDDLAVSHGTLLSHGNTLWAFQLAFYGDHLKRTHTRAYTLEETPNEWISRGVIIENGFYPCQRPRRLENGNWVMSGERVSRGYDFSGDPPAVAISRDNDFTDWELNVIPPAKNLGNLWGESSIFVDDSVMINVSRWGMGPGDADGVAKKSRALVAVSEDHGQSWTSSRPSNLQMATSKPYAGTLSNGQHYLICTTTAQASNRRHPLTIAVTRPGESVFSKIFIIRRAVFPEGPGESDPNARLSYPYAVEHDKKLYVAYSNDGGRGGNRNSAELAVIPVSALTLP